MRHSTCRACEGIDASTTKLVSSTSSRGGRSIPSKEYTPRSAGRPPVGRHASVADGAAEVDPSLRAYAAGRSGHDLPPSRFRNLRGNNSLPLLSRSELRHKTKSSQAVGLSSDALTA